MSCKCDNKSKCAPRNPVSDIVDCNCVPYPRECDGSVKMPFTNIRKPGDNGAESYPHEKDDRCNLLICGCPKTPAGVHYPVIGGDPVIGVKGGGAKFNPDTGEWELPNSLQIAALPDDCNGIEIVEGADGITYISTVKEENIVKYGDPVFSAPIVNAGPGEYIVADMEMCVTNDACSPWFGEMRFEFNPNYEGDAGSFGVFEISTHDDIAGHDGFFTFPLAVGLNGLGGDQVERGHWGVTVPVGATQCWTLEAKLIVTAGTFNFLGASTLQRIQGYTVNR